MKLKVLTTVLLLELSQLAAIRPSLSQNDLNAQLQEALCSQDWGRALQVIDQMKKVAGRQYASELTLYRGRLEVLARENAKVPEWTQGCADGNAGSGGNPSGSPTPAPNQPMPPPGTVPEVPTPNSPVAPSEPVPEVNPPTTPPEAVPEVPPQSPQMTPPTSGNNVQY